MMVASDALSQNDELDAARIGSADLIVAIPTYNNAETVGHVVESAVSSLTGALSAHRAVIVNPDGGSKDGTLEQVREIVADRVPLLQVNYPVYPVHRLAIPVGGIPGRAEALRAAFTLAQKLNAKACVTLESGLRTMSEGGLQRLALPVLERDFDFVAPAYVRHKFDGAINNAIVYPLMRALYGKRIRQPMGGDRAFSIKLIGHYAEKETWDGQARLGPDVWMTTQAITAGFQFCQALLGTRVAQARDVAPELSVLLGQVLGALFEDIAENAPFWQRVRSSEPVPVFGEPLEESTEPVQVNGRRMMESFRLGHHDLQEIWSLILPPATLFELKKLARRGDDGFRFGDDMWARIVYDFALGYRLRTIDRAHLLSAVTPLYLGWVGSFVDEMQNAEPDAVEQRLENLCIAFETQKRYLISRWRWPDRFSP
jgi:hypothetical protein